MITDWDQLEAKTYNALRAWLAMEDRKFEHGGEDIKALASRVVEFWRDESKGNLTARLLDAARPTAETLCIVYNVDSKMAPRKVADKIRCFAVVGSILVSSLSEDS
jgi:hypothetical protein